MKDKNDNFWGGFSDSIAYACLSIGMTLFTLKVVRVIDLSVWQIWGVIILAVIGFTITIGIVGWVMKIVLDRLKNAP